jgi:hypothetical protein
MKVIEYRVHFKPDSAVVNYPTEEVVRVKARDINSGFSKALKLAKEPLGSGVVREIAAIEFWQVV